MKLLISVALCTLLVASSAAYGDGSSSCRFVVGNGFAKQPEPFTPWLGPFRMRIGDHIIDGSVDVLATDGFEGLNESGQLAGFSKGTYDFGKIGAFHFWEVDTLTLNLDDFATADLEGRELTGPARDALPQDFAPWGTGAFATADADLKLTGWIDFGVVQQDGSIANELSFFVWGRLCNVDMAALAVTD